MDVLGLMNSLLGKVQAVSDVNAGEIELATISLAFVIVCARSLHQAWANGHDRAVPFIKDQAVKFMIVVALAMPLPILNGSFITTFPQAVVSAGLGAASTGMPGGGNVASYVNSEVDQMRGKQSDLGASLEAAWRDLKNNTYLADMLSRPMTRGGDILAWLGLSALVFLCLLPFVLMSVGLGAIGFVQGLSLALLCLWVGLELTGCTNASEGMAGPLQIIKTCSTLAGDFIFKAVLIFTFLGVMISIVIKSVIYVLTFPFAFVNMAFEQRRNIFIDNCAKGFQIALSAVIAGIIFQVCLSAYTLFAANGGPVEAMQTQFVGAMPSGGWVDRLGWVVKSLMVSIVGPSVLCIPIARFLTKSGEIAAGLIGGGGFMSGTQFGSAFSGKMPGMSKYSR